MSLKLKEDLKQLIAQKELYELEAEAITSELTSPGVNGERPAGIKDSLVDREGFPRDDIDIINVKEKRKRLAIINTNHKQLMKEIEKNLSLIYSDPLFTSSSQTTTIKSEVTEQNSRNETNTSIHSNHENTLITINSKAIAIIDEILTNSPAFLADLHNQDELLSFGYITAFTENSLTSIPTLIRQNMNKSIQLNVRRKNELLCLNIIPQIWNGRGVLGCHLTPIKHNE